MRQKDRLKCTFLDPIKNQRGSGQLIAYCACLGILLLIIIFATEISRFVITVNEQNDLTDSIMRDSMRINNGLTAQTQQYLEEKLENKGFNTSRLSISGTPAGMPFGSELSGEIAYEYQFPILRMIDSLYPDVTVSTQMIRSEVHVYALGVVR